MKKISKSSFVCIVLCLQLRYNHGGKSDIVAHLKTAKHAVAYKNSLEKMSKMTYCVSTVSNMQAIRAELLLTGTQCPINSERSCIEVVACHVPRFV